MTEYAYFDNYLKALDINQKDAIATKIRHIGMRDSLMKKRLDDWLSNFRDNDEKALAVKIFLNIDYFSEERIEELISKYKIKINQYLTDRSKNFNDLLLITPDGHADSADYHAYKLTKVWGIPRDRVLNASAIKDVNIRGKCLILFNDTHGSGNQFDRDFSNIINHAGAHNCYIVCVSITKRALSRFKSSYANITVIPEVSTPTLHETNIFTPNELKLIEDLGIKVYPKAPLGYGESALLVAYHFQCPNNNLPIVWANGKNNSYKTDNGDIIDGYPWIPLFEYRGKISLANNVTPVDNTHDIITIAELNEQFNVCRFDRVGKTRVKAIRSILASLEKIRSDGFHYSELKVRLWKQLSQDARNLKDYYYSLEKTQLTLEELLSNCITGIQTRFAFELFAEYAIDFSQTAGTSIELNKIVYGLNRAIRYLGQQIYSFDVANERNQDYCSYLCLRSKCRRALASLYRRRGQRGEKIDKQINLLRASALKDAECSYDLKPNPSSRLELALCLFANSATTSSEKAKRGLTLLNFAKDKDNDILASYELVKQLRMRFLHEDAAKVFIEILPLDSDLRRLHSYVTHFSAAVIGMHYDRTDHNVVKEYALMGIQLLEDIISYDRHKAREVIDLCYLKAICGSSIDESLETLRYFKPNAQTTWNELAKMAYEASSNVATLSDALLIGLDDAVIWSRIGSFYEEFVKDYKTAIDFYDRAISIDRRSPTFHLSKAQVLAYGLNDYQSAKVSLDYVHSLKNRKYAWYQMKKKEGVFAKLEAEIASNIDSR